MMQCRQFISPLKPSKPSRLTYTSPKKILQTRSFASVFTSTTKPKSSRIHPILAKHTKTMSSFSNTDTGSKTADPYKAANKDEPSLEVKIEALDKFVTYSKFGMMTTRDESSGKLVSRCMAIAGKVRLSCTFSNII